MALESRRDAPVMKDRLPQWMFLAFIGAVCLCVLPWIVRKLSIVSVGLAANEESQAVLTTNLADLRTLSRYDPAHAAVYRRHFGDTQALLHHLQILALSRRELTRRTQASVFATFAILAAFGVAMYFADQRRRAAKELRRVRELEYLSSWQEAARRHAHEIRTPLTTARMEVSSLMRAIAPKIPDAAEELRHREQSILDELERLRRFTNNFVAFASLPAPALRSCDLAQVARDFCALFAPNWPQLALRFDEASPSVHATADAAMLRQVLVNLCNNSALAIGEHGNGVVTFSVAERGGFATLQVADDGPGIPREVRRRLFEPYTTTRKIGEGMGLGLAISKKILLDHGGDLELVDRTRGTAFRLVLPKEEA